MRTHFADSLDDLAAGLASMCALTVTAIADATTALLDVDLPTAERVLDANTNLDKAAADWEHQAFSLLALQAPVAHDLRFTVGGLHIAASLQRMGGLATHVAKIARLRHPTPAVPTRSTASHRGHREDSGSPGHRNPSGTPPPRPWTRRKAGRSRHRHGRTTPAPVHRHPSPTMATRSTSSSRRHPPRTVLRTVLRPHRRHRTTHHLPRNRTTPARPETLL